MVLGKWRWKEGERDEWMEPTSLQYPLCVLDVVHRGLECAEQIGPCGTHSQGRGTPEIARASDRDRGPEGAGRDPGQCAAKRSELGRSLEDLSGEWLSPGRRWRSAAGQQSVPRGRESLDASAHRLPRSPGSEHIAVQRDSCHWFGWAQNSHCHQYPPWQDKWGPRSRSRSSGKYSAQHCQQRPTSPRLTSNEHERRNRTRDMFLVNSIGRLRPGVKNEMFYATCRRTSGRIWIGLFFKRPLLCSQG